MHRFVAKVKTHYGSSWPWNPKRTFFSKKLVQSIWNLYTVLLPHKKSEKFDTLIFYLCSSWTLTVKNLIAMFLFSQNPVLLHFQLDDTITSYKKIENFYNQFRRKTLSKSRNGQTYGGLFIKIFTLRLQKSFSKN